MIRVSGEPHRRNTPERKALRTRFRVARLAFHSTPCCRPCASPLLTGAAWVVSAAPGFVGRAPPRAAVSCPATLVPAAPQMLPQGGPSEATAAGVGAACVGVWLAMDMCQSRQAAARAARVAASAVEGFAAWREGCTAARAACGCLKKQRSWNTQVPVRRQCLHTGATSGRPASVQCAWPTHVKHRVQCCVQGNR